MTRVISILALLLTVSSAMAQQVPNHAMPVGRGPSISSFNFVGPCTIGKIPQYTSNAAADPSCQSITKYRFANDAYDTFIMDDFDAVDGTLIQGRVSPTGQTWAATGTGAATTKIVGGVAISAAAANNTYMAMDYGKTLSYVSGAFSLGPDNSGTDPTASGVTIIADQDSVGLNTMLHLQMSATTWTLDKRISGGSFIGLASGVYNLLTDGTVYGVAMAVDNTNHTVTVFDPGGGITTVTDADIGVAIIPRYAEYQLGASTGGYVARWHSVAAGPTSVVSLRGLGMGAPMSAIAFLTGNTGTRLQRTSFVTPATSDWYRIATQTTYSTFTMMGHVKISSVDSATAQQLEFNVAALAAGTPYLAQEFSAQNNVFNQVRLSTDSVNHLIGLDVHLNAARAATVNVEFEGFFTPVLAPVAGATVLPTANTVMTATPASPGLTVTKTVRASGGASDCTLIFVGGLLSGGSC